MLQKGVTSKSLKSQGNLKINDQTFCEVIKTHYELDCIRSQELFQLQTHLGQQPVGAESSVRYPFTRLPCPAETFAQLF